MMKKKQAQVSSAVFASVFVVSTVLGDGISYGKNTVRAAIGQEVSLEHLEALTDDNSIVENCEITTVAVREGKTLIVDVYKAASELGIEADGLKEAWPEPKQASQETELEMQVADTKEAELAAQETDVDYVIADVETSLNIRTEPSAEAEIIGKLYRGAKADIVERGEEWTKIASGGLEGFVSSEYLMFDEDAIEGAQTFGVQTATVEVDSLRMRQEPNTQAAVLKLMSKGDKLLVADTEQETEGWVPIAYSDDEIGYVSADFVTEAVELKEAISLEEEQRIQEEERKRQQDASSAVTGTANRAAVGASQEEAYLLAAVVQMEAGNQCYEGRLAVANVVVNRLLSGKWGNTISQVVYAEGQFSGVAGGLLQRYINQGPDESSKKAAAEAIAGVNNIGDYLFFCANRVAHYSSYSRYTIIQDHCFYQR